MSTHHTTTRRADRGRWAATASLADLARLTEAWLTGEIASQPGYHGPVDVDEDQAPGLTAALVALCRAGMVTRNSQAGYLGSGADGARWVQHAAVTGYADTDAWYRLLQAMDGARYLVLAHTVRPLGHRGRPGVVVTWRDGRPHTEFGAQLAAGQVRGDLDGAGRPAVMAAVCALQVTIWDPVVGANTLWGHLAGVFADPLAPGEVDDTLADVPEVVSDADAIRRAAAGAWVVHPDLTVDPYRVVHVDRGDVKVRAFCGGDGALLRADRQLRPRGVMETTASMAQVLAWLDATGQA